MATCGNIVAMGQNISSVQNPECLWPQPVWPPGNNGNVVNGLYLQGPNNVWPTGILSGQTSPDNIFQWELNWTQFDSVANGFTQGAQYTGTIQATPNFYALVASTGVTGPSPPGLTNAVGIEIQNQLNSIVPNLKDNVGNALINSFVVNLTASTPSNPPTQVLEIQMIQNSNFIPDSTVTNTNNNETASNYFFLQPATTGTNCKFSQCQAGPATLPQIIPAGPTPLSPSGTIQNPLFAYSLLTGTQIGTDPTGISLTGAGRLGGIAIAPSPTFLDGTVSGGVNTYATLPDFQYFPQQTDQQTRAQQFNPAGCSGVDGASNQAQPPWVFQPGLDRNDNFTNICSNNQGPGANVPGAEGLTQLQPIAGNCSKRPSQDLCQNPCVRDPNNGMLKPNPQTSQCRVFTNISDANTVQCPTVCPQQCVEMWENCPPGTGLLITLTNTLDSTDVLSLQGPILAYPTATVTPNPQFPTDRNGTSPIVGPWPNPNRPQKECQAFGATHCSLALANLYQQTDGTPICAASCPNGFENLVQYCSKNIDTQLCTGINQGGGATASWNKDGLGPFFNGAQICVPSNGPSTKNIVCDPNQFVPWQGPDKGSIRIYGCATQKIPVIGSTTCPSSTNTMVNDLFSAEWCQNQCANSQVPDPSQSTCIATCDGSIWDTNDTYLQQWDQYDIFLTDGRCLTGTTCSSSAKPGACPSQTQTPPTSFDLVNSVLNHGKTTGGILTKSKVDGKSIQEDLPQDDEKRGLTKKDYRDLRNAILKDQQARNKYASTSGAQNVAGLASCPTTDGGSMEFIVHAQNGETVGRCQDKCAPGFKPNRACRSNATTDVAVAILDDPALCPKEDLITTCLPSCPSGWDEDNRVPGLYNCTYRQPGFPKQEFPPDELTWKTCPIDGRFQIVNQSGNTVNKEIIQGKQFQGPPLCIRQPQERLSTCPLGYYDNPTNLTCTKMCGDLDIVMYQSDPKTGKTITKCVRACTQDGRFIQQYESMQDPNINPKYAANQCQRNAVYAGSGSDPAAYPVPTPSSRNNIIIAVSFVVGILALIIILAAFRSSRNTSNSA